MAKQRGGAKKLRRSGRKAAYYTRQHIVTARNKARRALKRKANIEEKEKARLAGSAWMRPVDRIHADLLDLFGIPRTEVE